MEKSDNDSATRWYSVRTASELVGLTDDAIRKRFALGKVNGVVADGVVRIAAEGIERERSQLLRRLQAIDARAASADDAVMQLAAVIAERDALTSERDSLRAELITARAVAQSLAQASAAALDASRAHLDAVQQSLMPTTPDG